MRTALLFTLISVLLNSACTPEPEPGTPPPSSATPGSDGGTGVDGGIPPNPDIDATSSYTLQKTDLFLDTGSFLELPSSFSSAISYADFDADGDTDVVLGVGRHASPDETPVQFHRQVSPGKFERVDWPDAPGMVHPRKALTGDFNGDGRMDVFLIGHGYDLPPFPGERLKLLLNTGTGFVTQPGVESFSSFFHGGGAADIDADGDLDVFVASNSQPRLLMNRGDGTFDDATWKLPKELQFRGLFTAELTDVDKDGFADLWVAGHEHEGMPTRILWGDSSGRWVWKRGTDLPKVTGMGTVVDLDADDLDADGDRDLVLSRTGGEQPYVGCTIQVLEATAARTYADRSADWLPGGAQTSLWVVWLRIQDLDGDGDLDLLADDASRDLRWQNDGTGHLTPLTRLITANPALEETSSYALQKSPLHINRGMVRNASNGTWVNALAYGDFNKDSEPDVVMFPNNGSDPHPAELYLGAQGSLSLATWSSPVTMTTPSKAISGDFDGNGWLDVITFGWGPLDVTPYPGEPVRMLLNGPTGFTRSTELERHSSMCRTGASADVDNDGDLDLFMSCGDGMKWLINSGDATFQSRSGQLLETEGHSDVNTAELLDVDKDGFADLWVAASEAVIATQIFWGDASGKYTAARRTVIPPVADQGLVFDLDAEDLDGDGDRDLLVQRKGSTNSHYGHYIQVLEATAPRTFVDRTAQWMPVHSGSGSIDWLRVQDMDADGDPDVIADDRATGLMWRNDGAGQLTPTTF